MNSSDRKAVDQAKQRKNPKQSQVSGKAGATALTETLDKAVETAADAMVNQFGAKVINRFLSRIGSGDLGILAGDMLGEGLGAFSATLESEYLAIEAAEADPKLLPFGKD